MRLFPFLLARAPSVAICAAQALLPHQAEGSLATVKEMPLAADWAAAVTAAAVSG